MADTGAPTEPQLVQCPKHGYFYNPKHATGCRACGEAALQTSLSRTDIRPRRSGRLIAVGVVGLLGWGAYSFLGAMGRRGEEVYIDSKATEGRFNPGLVRLEIQELEALVYAESASVGLGERIEYASLVLHDAIQAHATPLLAGRIGPDILAFGSMASAAESSGYARLDLELVRREWEKTRSRVFWEVDWYRSAEP